MRFDDSTIGLLLQTAWWNWDIEKINNNIEIAICSMPFAIPSSYF